jgi:hypothetical protein
MKITYNHNPLKTTIELSKKEKGEFWQRIKVEELIWIIADIEYHLDELGNFNLEKARKSADTEYCCDKEDGINKLVNDRYQVYLDALQDIHLGDCTYVACSCVKCHAEHILGIDTIKGLRGSSAYHVAGAFEKNRNIHQAIEYLKNYQPKIEKGWEAYEEGWKAQAKEALEWLTKYRDENNIISWQTVTINMGVSSSG